MLSEVPVEIEKLQQSDINKETLRAAMMAELDAINLYEEMANLTDNDDVERVLLDIVEDEMEHMVMFLTVLFEVDKKFLKTFTDWSLTKPPEEKNEE